MSAALLVCIVVIFDQASKFLVSGVLSSKPGQTCPVIEDFFSLTLVYNRGGVFGLFPRQNALFVVLSLVTIAVLIALLLHRRFFPPIRPARIAGGLILGGAVGNLIDRLKYNYVVDFLDFQFGDYHWPAFNLADSVICLGVGLLIGLALFSGGKKT